MSLTLRLMGTISALCLVTSLPAAVISFTETGDRSPFDPQNVGTLDVGTNVINGSLAAGWTTSGDSSDAWDFDLPMGLTISSITYSLSAGPINGAQQFRFVRGGAGPFDGTLLQADDTIAPQGAGDVSLFSAAFPETTPGLYRVAQLGSNGATGSGPSLEDPQPYQWTIEVASVPELSTVPYVVLSMSILFGTRKRRR